MEKEHYLLGEAARILKIPPYSLAYLLTTGRAEEPKLRIGGKRVFTPDEIERILVIIERRRKDII